MSKINLYDWPIPHELLILHCKQPDYHFQRFPILVRFHIKTSMNFWIYTVFKLTLTMLFGPIFLVLLRVSVCKVLRRLSPLWRPYLITRSAQTTVRPGKSVLKTMCLEDDPDGGNIWGDWAGALFNLLTPTGTSEFSSWSLLNKIRNTCLYSCDSFLYF